MGDGEWSAILQDRPRTSSGSQGLRIKRLKQLMRMSVINAYKDARYILSMRPGSQRAGIEVWLSHNQAKHIKWHDCRVFYQSSKHGKLYPFIKAVRECGYPVTIVGPERLRAMNGKVFDIAHFVKIPNKDCFVLQESIMQQVLDIGEPSFVMFSAGPAAKVMCWQLHSKIGGDSFLFDLGSLFDPYVGKRTRTYHKLLLREPWRIKKNLTGHR
jgi:hypothetical protein